MAEGEGGAAAATTSTSSSTAAATTATAAATTTTTAPSRPEYLPEQFWDGTKNAPNVEGLARAYTDLGQRFAKGKDGLVPVIKQELETERLKARPEKPDGYALDLKEGTQLPNNLVMLKEPPGKDFKPEPGKRYFYLKPDDPLMGIWRDVAHKAGFSQDDFQAWLITYADKIAAVTPTPEQVQQQRTAALNAQFAKLGENGSQRVAHAFNGLKAMIGEQNAMALDGLPLDAGAFQALEALVEKAGGPKFMPQGGASSDAGVPTMAEVRALQGEVDYWESPIKQQKVFDMLTKINAAKRGKAA